MLTLLNKVMVYNIILVITHTSLVNIVFITKMWQFKTKIGSRNLIKTTF